MVEHSTVLGSRFLEVRWQDGDLLLSLRRSFDEFPGLKLRRPEARRNARSVLKSVGELTWSEDDIVVRWDGRMPPTNDVVAALQDVDLRLDRIAWRPLTSRLVEEALGISTSERSRWTKDGRLKRSGTDLIRRGQPVGLSTYAVTEIAKLMNEPETIQAWRAADQRAAVG